MLTLFKSIIFLVGKKMFEMSPMQNPLRWVPHTREKKVWWNIGFTLGSKVVPCVVSRGPRCVGISPLITTRSHTTSLSWRASISNHYTFETDIYQCAKYRNNPYYKGAQLWKLLPRDIQNCDLLSDVKRKLVNHYKPCNDILL